jgi:putative NADH-flavin reductase
VVLFLVIFGKKSIIFRRLAHTWAKQQAFTRNAMKILIIGGTGFIGPWVVKRLHAAGHTVTLFNRGKTRYSVPAGVNHIAGDRKNLAQFKDVFRKTMPEVVLDMVPLTQQDAQTVVDTFGNIAGRVVAVSSQDVYRAYGITTA